jgi:hypothetical protein
MWIPPKLEFLLRCGLPAVFAAMVVGLVVKVAAVIGLFE